MLNVVVTPLPIALAVPDGLLKALPATVEAIKAWVLTVACCGFYLVKWKSATWTNIENNTFI